MKIVTGGLKVEIGLKARLGKSEFKVTQDISTISGKFDILEFDGVARQRQRGAE